LQLPRLSHLLTQSVIAALATKIAGQLGFGRLIFIRQSLIAVSMTMV
jgi:hypothetical protein